MVRKSFTKNLQLQHNLGFIVGVEENISVMSKTTKSKMLFMIKMYDYLRLSLFDMTNEKIQN